MSYLSQAQSGVCRSHLGEDPSYTISDSVQKASTVPQAVAMAARRRKMSTPRENAIRDAQLTAFLKTLPANTQLFVRQMAQRYANAGTALNGYSGAGCACSLGDIASAVTAIASIYLGYEGIQAQKDAQDAANKRAKEQAARDAAYQKAQLEMAQQQQAFAQQQVMQQQAGTKAGMSTGTKVAIGAGVVAAAGAAYMAMN